jgi:hypothetical protein
MRVPLLLVVVVAGCTNRKTIMEAHELAGSEVEVSGRYGQKVSAVGVAGPGGVTFVDKASGGVVPAEEIYRIDDTSHALGAVQGLGIGAGIGAVLGAVLGYSAGDDDVGDDGSHGGDLFELSAGDKAAIGGILLGGLGGLVGLVAGAMKGSTTIYERGGSSTVITPVGPPGSAGGVTIAF